MRAGIETEHRRFFGKHGYIAFHDLFPKAELLLAKDQVDLLLKKRTKKLSLYHTPKELFIAGRDPSRDDPILRQLVHARPLAEMAMTLFDVTSVRFAYDQIIRSTELTTPVFDKALPLQEVSCFQPLLGGALIRLTDDPNLRSPLFPGELGSVVVFNAGFQFPWPLLTENKEQCFLLIAYAPVRCLYVLEPRDPHTHMLKHHGYGFGDLLEDRTHPRISLH
jgi:hypothetical protein